MATEKETELRNASREGKVDIVNKLLDEGVAQTADEVQNFLTKIQANFLCSSTIYVSQTFYYFRPTVRFVASFPSLC